MQTGGEVDGYGRLGRTLSTFMDTQGSGPPVSAAANKAAVLSWIQGLVAEAVQTHDPPPLHAVPKTEAW